MTKIRPLLRVLVTFLTLGTVAYCAGLYVATDLGTLGGPTYPLALNSSGQVVGESDVNGIPHAFLYSNGVVQDIGSLAGGQTLAYGINDAGQVVGESRVSSGFQHAYQYSGGLMTDLTPSNPFNSGAAAIRGSYIAGNLETTLGYRAFVFSGGVLTLLPTLGGTSGFGQGINSLGQAVGFSQMAGDLNYHAFRYSGGIMTDIGTLGGPHSFANAINTSGAIVGYSTPAGVPAGDYHAFKWINGAMTDLGTLGGPVSIANAINDGGQVVGQTDSGMGTRAFIYDQGSMEDLNNLVSVGTILTSAKGINNAGQIVATATNARAYLLTPTPPSDQFVTGSGWFDSQSGALSGSAVSGKATFSFNPKYNQGATAPSGHLEFRFQAGNLVFQSTAYQWLLIDGAKARFKAVGTVNGSGSYDFTATAVDGSLLSGGGQDAFRLKISNGNGVVYDNQPNVNPEDPVVPINAGSIVIHK